MNSRGRVHPAPVTAEPSRPPAPLARRAAGHAMRARAGNAVRARAGHPAARHLVILGGYLAAGVAVTWPRASYLAGHKLPATRDAGAYVWCFWWVARQAEHLSSPWFTRYLAAPVGTPLGLHVLMPLEGVVMMPVTVTFGPSASYNLLSAAMPGLLCYAAYRVARLWLPSQAGAIAAGGFFGLSSMLTWRSWYHLNLAAGAVFLPLALEAAVRLRRKPGTRQAVLLGLTLAACLLTDQESAVMAAIVVVLALLLWLTLHPGWAKTCAVALAAAVATVAGGPQIAAVASQAAAGGAATSMRLLAQSYTGYGTKLAGLFAPSPRTAGYGPTRLAAIYYHHGVIYQTINHRLTPTSEATPMFGLVLTALAGLGLVLSWRRRSAWLLGLLWLGAAALALGPVLWVGTRPFTRPPRRWTACGSPWSCPTPGSCGLPGCPDSGKPGAWPNWACSRPPCSPGPRWTGSAITPPPPSSPSWRPPSWKLAGQAVSRPASCPPATGSAPCPPRCRRLTARSPPTTPRRSSSISPSASAAEPAPMEPSTARRPRCSRPPTGTRVRSASSPACPLHRRRDRRARLLRGNDPGVGPRGPQHPGTGGRRPG